MNDTISARPRRSLPMLFVMLAVTASPLLAQAPPASRVSGSVGLLNTQPLGELATGPGVGLALAASYALDPTGIFGVRADFRVASYGSDDRELCLGGGIGCWIRVDLNTEYTYLYAGAGPEIALPLPGFDLLLVGTVGLSRFAVSSSLDGVDDHNDFGTTTHFEDNFFAWSTGAELRIPVSRKVAISAGGHYQGNGRASYVPDGGVSENPDGTLNVGARTTDANLVALTLGVAFRP